MGQPPSPSYATVYFGIHEIRLLKRFPGALIPHNRRYIDDYIGVWIPMQNGGCERMWNKFKKEMNNYHGLTWEFSERTDKVDYLDVTISINNGKTTFDLYEKSLNLYLYIPPLSAHPPGVLSGLVLGNCHRIYTLVSKPEDQRRHLTNFFRRLLRRGYQRSTLLPLFQRASSNAHNPRPSTITNIITEASPAFFHTQYHPDAPKSSVIQHHWKTQFASPPFERPFSEVKNLKGVKTGIKRLIIAYSRPSNLCNILSRKDMLKTSPHHLAVSLHQEVRQHGRVLERETSP